MKKNAYAYFSIWFLLFTFITLYVTAQPEQPVIAYVTIQGMKQGQFKGGAMGAKQGTIECVGFSYSVQSPVDLASGMPTGKRQHSPVVIVKHLDGATPQLLQAAYSNEALKSVTIEFTKRGPDGRAMIYQTIQLSNASISRVSQYGGTASPDKLIPNNGILEEISISFQKIEITNNDAKTTAADSWNNRQ